MVTLDNIDFESDISCTRYRFSVGVQTASRFSVAVCRNRMTYDICLLKVPVQIGDERTSLK